MVKYIGWSKDYTALEKSASGGIIFELGRYFIENLNGVVIGVHLLDSGQLVWDTAETLEELHKLQGSKYWRPTGWEKMLNEILPRLQTEGKNIMFAGTPKQCYKVRKKGFKNILIVQFECNGYNTEPNHYRGQDRPTIPWKQSANKIPREYIYQKSTEKICHMCPALTQIGSDGQVMPGIYNAADITLGDAWGCHESYINELGTSRIIIHSFIGSCIIRYLKDNDRIELVVESKSGNYPHKNRVALFNIENQNNIGSSLLSTNLIASFPELDFVVFLHPWGNNKFTMDRIIKGSGRKDLIFRSMVINALHIPYYWLHSLSLPELKDCNTIIINGEDNWCGSTQLPERWRGWMLFLTLCILHKKKIYFINGTMGEIPWWVRPWFKWVLMNCKKVYVRDYWSVDQLEKQLNFTSEFCPDMGFLTPNGFREQDKEDFAIYTPSVWARYCNSVDGYIDKCIKDIQEIEKKYPKVIIMPHDDRECNIPIYQELSDKTECELYVPHTPTDARQMYNKALEVWTYRMHSYIQCVSVGTKCNILSPYSPKFNSMQEVVSLTSIKDLQNILKKTIQKIKNEVLE